jgi:membrane protein implicated in regulation of membrane protease activity
MGRRAAVALYVLAMVGIVVGVDVLFLRMLFWERLIVNIGIVLVFVVVYFRFLKRPLAPSDVQLRGGSPDRIRTGVTALRGRRPRPLDDGAEHGTAGSCRTGMLAAPAA